MALILDISIVLIVALTMFFVVKKGFVKSVLRLVSVVCSVVFAKMFSSVVAEFLYGILHSVVSPRVDESIGEFLENGILPDFLQNDNLSMILQKYDILFIDKEETVGYISNSITAILSYFLAYILIFVGVLLAFKFITPIICLIFKLPVLRTANKLLSIVLGIVTSALYLFVFVSLMQALIPLLSSLYPEFISDNVIEKTYIFNYLYSLEWIKIFLK